MRIAEHPLVNRVRQMGAAERVGDPVMLALGAAVGLATGLLAVALISLIAGVQAAAFGIPLPDEVLVIVMPALGGLLVGVLVTYWVPEVRGPGVTNVMGAIALHGGRMRPVVAPAKVLASGLALGTGMSGGRESPIVQVGGSVGSTVGRVFALDEDRKRALIAAGAGAGIAASFNAPIAGMLFALEVIIGGFRARYLQVVVVACVVASVTARELVGPALIYNPPPYRTGVLRNFGLTGVVGEFALYGLLGLAAVVVGLVFIRAETLAGRFADRLRVWPPLVLALGGLLVGATALLLPEVLGTGDHLPPVLDVATDPIAEMLDGTLGGAGLLAAGFLLLLLVAKLAVSAIAIGTGNPVGSFGPSVFMGAALGGAFGHVATVLLPDTPIRPGAFALVGMAAVLGATQRAPLTAILLAFELTGDYGLVLPLMLATGIAVLVSDQLRPGSVYTLPLLRRGIVYGEPEDIDIMQTVRVGEVMTPDPETVPADMPLPELIAVFRESRYHGFPVLDGDRLVGVVTLTDLAKPGVDGLGGGALTAGDICTRPPVTVTPDDAVFRAVRRMAAIDAGRMPVVSPDDHGKLVGLVRRADIVKAYQRGVTRSLGVQQRRDSSRLRDLAGAQFIELHVESGAPAAGQAVRDVTWPERTVLTSVRRAGDLIMPHGDTVLEPGDEVVALTDQASVEELRQLVAGGGEL